VLDDEAQVGEERGWLVYVADVEGVFVERVDRRPLVDVEVDDAQLLALLQEPHGLGAGELPPLRAALPLGRVELDAHDVVLALQPPQVLQSTVAVAWIERAVEDEAVGVRLFRDTILLGGVEAVD